MGKKNTNPIVLDAFDAVYIHDKQGFEYLVRVADRYQTDNKLVNRVEISWIKRSK